MAKKLMRFEVLGGKHHHSDGKVYNKGESFTHDKDISKTFLNKFKRLQDFEFPAGQAEKGASVATTDNDTNEDEDEEKTPPIDADKAVALAARGKDVTDKFPVAVKFDYLVFKRGSHYSVYEAEETTPLKGCEGLEKVAVSAAIEKLLET